MQFLAIIGIGLMVGMLVWIVYSIIQNEVGTKRMLFMNSALFVVVILLLRFCAPAWSNKLIYQGIVQHLYLVFALMVGGGAVFGMHILQGRRHTDLSRNAWIFSLIVGVVSGGLVWFLGFTAKSAFLAKEASFQKVESYVEADANALRFTPLEVAFAAMQQKFSESEFDIQKENLHPLDLDGGFGYIVPVEPIGLINPFTRLNDGFVVYDDNPGTADGERVKRIHEELKVGPGVYITNNLERRLYDSDWFAEYPEVYYLQLGGKDAITAVAPKIKYRLPWGVPVPYWAGVTLVHSSGDIEQLSVEQAIADKRLSRKMIYPSSLARKSVEAQRFDAGFFSGYFKRQNKIKIPELPGSNQMPYLMRAKDGRSYFVVAAEPDGDKSSLFRLYYVDATTGERFYYQFDSAKAALIGPETSVKQVRQLPGYKWIEGQGGSESAGDFRILESVFLPKGDRIYWKWTVTTKSNVGVVLTAVVDADTLELLTFKDRAGFIAWLKGEVVQQSNGLSAETESEASSELEAIENLLKEATRRLEELRKKNGK